jgi:hypothetical protein
LKEDNGTLDRVNALKTIYEVMKSEHHNEELFRIDPTWIDPIIDLLSQLPDLSNEEVVCHTFVTDMIVSCVM